MYTCDRLEAMARAREGDETTEGDGGYVRPI